MTHNQVYFTFTQMFPIYVSDGLIFFPNGKNSVRIRGIIDPVFEGKDVIFTYGGRHNWKLESVDCFIKNTLKGD